MGMAINSEIYYKDSAHMVQDENEIDHFVRKWSNKISGITTIQGCKQARRPRSSLLVP